MEILNLNTAQLWCVISLTLATIECCCFYWIKYFMNNTILNDIIFEQLNHFFNELKPHFIISYVSIYAALLLAAKFWIYLFIIIVGIQGISLLCNTAIIIHFIKKKNDK